MRKSRPAPRLFATKLIVSAILPFIAGGVNVSGFLAVGAYTSHVTGHVTRLGGELVQHHLGLALSELGFVVCFTLGVMASTSLVAVGRARPRARHAVSLLLEAGILATFASWSGWQDHLTSRALMVAMLCFGMGMQNALVTQAFGAVMRTTHLTGICTDLGIEATRLLFWMRARSQHLRLEGPEGQRSHPSLWQELVAEVEWAQLRTHASVLVSYFGGAVLGTALYLRLGQQGVALYCLVLVVLAYYDLRWGIRRLDL